MDRIDTDDGFNELSQPDITFELELEFTIETRPKLPVTHHEEHEWLGEISMLLVITLTPLVLALLFATKIEYDPYGHVSGWWLLAHLTALAGLGYFVHREKSIPMLLAVAALYTVTFATGINPAKFLGQHLGTYGWVLGFCMVLPSTLFGAIISHAEESAKPA